MAEKNRYGLLAMQLHEDLVKGLELLSKYAHHSKEYPQLLQIYTKCVALFQDLTYNYDKAKIKKLKEKTIYNSLCEYYRRFMREISHYVLSGIGTEWTDLYDNLILGWESLAQSSKVVDEADKINYCWETFWALTCVTEEYDPEDMVPEHLELLEYILDDWEYALTRYTDAYNQGAK